MVCEVVSQRRRPKKARRFWTKGAQNTIFSESGTNYFIQVVWDFHEEPDSPPFLTPLQFRLCSCSCSCFWCLRLLLLLLYYTLYMLDTLYFVSCSYCEVYTTSCILYIASALNTVYIVYYCSCSQTPTLTRFWQYCIYCPYCIYCDGTDDGIADAIALALVIARGIGLAFALALAFALVFALALWSNYL